MEPKPTRKPRKRTVTPTAPAWTNKEANERATAKVTRIIVLYELHRRGRLNDVAMNKSALAKTLGVTRTTLDRSLATLQDAIAQADEFLKSSKF